MKTRMITILTAMLVLLLPLYVIAEESSKQAKITFENDASFKPTSEIDNLILANLSKNGIKPANQCSDAVFVRRIYLDLLGTLPKTNEVKTFLQDRDPQKRGKLIAKLFNRDEFATYWTMKWSDLLRVKAEFPVNLWPNAVQAYSRWIRDAIKNNLPYDQFARQLLTASGSNFRVPQVNFYRAVQGKTPSALAKTAALTFMGVRLENWPKEKQAQMDKFFSRVAFKNTAEWKEEIVFLDPAPSPPLKLTFPDGKKATAGQFDDPRALFADWLISPTNPWFAKNIANRAWSWFMGRGIIHEPDDIRSDNPPVNPELLSYLEKEFVKSNYDLRRLFSLILNSSTYQQSSIPQTDSPQADILFACYPVRQLEAEVLLDAICMITETHEEYSSPIPEPFTYIPEQNRTIELADGSITSQFLEMFGRPSRDTGQETERTNNATAKQRLHLLNSSHIQQKLQRCHNLNQIPKRMKWNKKKIMDELYLTFLSRYPTFDELVTLKEYANKKEVKKDLVYFDLAWALVNSKEFLCRH